MGGQRLTSMVHVETGDQLSPLLRWDSTYLVDIRTHNLEVSNTL
jgi:hypothetical protein